jgi:hypothetical protein
MPIPEHLGPVLFKLKKMNKQHNANSPKCQCCNIDGQTLSQNASNAPKPQKPQKSLTAKNPKNP